MRTKLIPLLCVAGTMIWAVNLANAVELEWTLLMDSSIAGAVPQQVGPRYLVLPGSTGGNNCNFSVQKGCETGATPTEGSYSFSAIEFDDTLTHSCLDLSAGPYAGVLCVCAEPAGQPCTSDAACSSSSCAGAGDCCPGALNVCVECTQDPSGPDSFSFFGIHPTLGPAPNMDTCQVYTTNDFAATRYQVGSSGDAEQAGACIKLNPDNLPYTGSPCNVGPVSGSLDVDIYVGGCTFKGTTIQNITYIGDVIDVNDTTPESQCGYSESQILVMLAQASAKGGQYLEILCGETTVPADSKTVCLRNAYTQFVTVAYTAGDASDCSGTCP